ncbi:AAA family ATPase [Candidatus Woesearchaeota archaeon]|nr:AAA family ATPase [Candidatus Woesearchaeota archaeon]
MITKAELREIVLKHQQELKKDLGIKRDFQIKLLKKFITIISGIRRCGKSTLIRQFLKEKSPIYYLYFEDISLSKFELKDFSKLDGLFIELLGENGIYFFDEIQNIKGWEIYARSLVDAGKQVIITGSNASMLSKELGTRLTGRNLRYELYPFSFNEFLKLRRTKPNIKNFEAYMKEGGFPEYIKLKDQDILRNLFEDIFYRDIVVRNDIRNETELKSLLYYLISNIGKEVSYNKLKDMVNVGSTNTITQFIHAFTQAYMLFPLNKFDFSYKKQIVNPKKIYCIDNALILLNAFSFSKNKGRLLENLVFISLKREGKEIYYHKNKKECDFIIKKGDKISEAIQVCYELSEDNREREIEGIIEAIKSYQLKQGSILTYNEEDELEIDGKRIFIKPVWKWLLER